MPKPPPDHLIPFSWLEKAGVSQVEIDSWIELGIVSKVDVHGGATFCHFRGLTKPVKFRELQSLIDKARSND